MTLSVAIEHRQGAFSLDAAFECGKGVTALFGRSGAGKTTIINAIAGLVSPRRGRVVFDGDTLFDTERGVDVPPGKRRFGYVFQEGRLFPHLTVRQNLLYSRLFDRTPYPEKEFAHLVELLGICDLLERRPAQLSGGERQRVAIGRALLAQPRLLLLDEPLAALDAHRKNEILRYLELLRDEVRIPMIYVSHTVEEVVRLADAVVLLADGKTVATGSVEHIMGRTDLRLAGSGFEGGAVIDARVIEQDVEHNMATLSFDGGVLTMTNVDGLIGEPVRVRIRARDVSIALDKPQRISIQNVLQGRISDVHEDAAGIADVAIVVGAVTLRSRVTHRAVERLGLAPDIEVYALIKAVSLA